MREWQDKKEKYLVREAPFEVEKAPFDGHPKNAQYGRRRWRDAIHGCQSAPA